MNGYKESCDSCRDSHQIYASNIVEHLQHVHRTRSGQNIREDSNPTEMSNSKRNVLEDSNSASIVGSGSQQGAAIDIEHILDPTPDVEGEEFIMEGVKISKGKYKKHRKVTLIFYR